MWFSGSFLSLITSLPANINNDEFYKDTIVRNLVFMFVHIIVDILLTVEEMYLLTVFFLLFIF